MLVLWLGSATGSVHADQVELQDGERLAGKVLAMTTNTVVIESELLGKVSLRRDQVAVITLGPRTTNAPPNLAASTNRLSRALKLAQAKKNLTSTNALGQLEADTNSILQVQKQLLSDAGPEANNLFSRMAAGVLSGKITVSDLRAQAQAVADQARALKRDGGEDPSGMLDAYLGILDDFLRDSAPASDAPGKASGH